MAENVEFVVSAKDLATDVFAGVEKGLKGIGGQLVDLKGLVGGLAGTLGVGLFVHMIDSTLRSQAELVRLGEVAGVSAAKMSALKGPADLAGTSLDNVAGIVAKLSKAVGEAQFGDGSKKSLFAAMGIDPADGRDAADRLLQVSRVLANMTDQNAAAYAASELLGKSFAEARPLMKELAELDELKARTTNEAAAAAKQYEDNLKRLAQGSMDLRKALANELLPSINDVVSAMVRAQKEGGALAMIVAGIQTAATGTDQYKNDKEIVELTARKLELQNKIDELRNTPAMATPGVKGDQGASTIEYWQKELDKLNEQLRTTMTYRKELESPGSIFGKATAAQGGADGMDDAAIRALVAEDKLLKELAFQKRYPVLVAEAEGFGKQYAAAIKTSDQLLQEAFKQGELGEKEMIRAIEANNQARITVEIQQLQKLKALARQKHDDTRAAQLEQQIIEKQAEKEASGVIATARVNSVDGKSDAEWRKDLAQRMTRIQTETMTQREALTHAMLQKKIDIELAEEAGLVDAMEAARQRELVEMQHQAALGDITAQGSLARRNFQQMTLSMQVADVVGAFAQITSGAALHNRTLFEVNKVASIANAIINTATGATRALAAYPPPISFVMAAAQIAAGLVQVATIQSTSFGGGGTPSSPTPVFPANPNTGFPEAPRQASESLQSSSASSGPPPAPTVFNVTLVGETVKTEQVRDLMQMMKDQLPYGATLNIEMTPS